MINAAGGRGVGVGPSGALGGPYTHRRTRKAFRWCEGEGRDTTADRRFWGRGAAPWIHERSILLSGPRAADAPGGNDDPAERYGLAAPVR
ncbi:hypothetical protein GCM10018782_06660 [Streptomyces griseoaurantiacus]|nr:hypothetical protein GCM10018782_06660 [Streptomyces griseoaurantiacus]